MSIEMTRGSGNVFLDIGFPRGEAVRLKIRSSMMGLATRTIEERGLTRKKAAIALGVTQARADDLRHGRIENFKIDSLVEMLTNLGVELEFRAKIARPRKRASR